MTERFQHACKFGMVKGAFWFLLVFIGCQATPSNPTPPAGRPQHLLSHSADFFGHSPLRGASGFLLECRGETMLAAARHLLHPAGGVSPRIAVDSLDDVLDSWRAFVRTRERSFALVTGLRFDGNRRGNGDWLLLAVDPSFDAGATALSIRNEAVQVGEQLTLLGCPYVERHCTQNEYRVRVTQLDRAELFRFALDEPVDLRGFSGAPVLDDQGRVVGLFSLWFPRQQHDGKDLVGGAESVLSIAEYCGDAS